MAALSPNRAAKIAAGVYNVRRNLDIQKLEKAAGLGLGEDFRVAGTSAFQGTTGAFMFKSRTGFGYIAEGQGAGRQGEVVIATRGTVNSHDWLTDANFMLENGPSGWPVHAGFNRTFSDFKGEIIKYFSAPGRNPTHVHCIGHSLGGALASLTADLVSSRNIADVSLYTFGSPRPGAMGFSHNLTRRVKPGNIYRVYHDADPVAMLPIFPYAHVGDTFNYNYMMSWRGCFISFPAHYKQNYIDSVTNLDWPAMHFHALRSQNELRVGEWLESVSTQGVMSGAAATFWMISRCLNWIIKKALSTVRFAIAAGETLLDRLSWLLVHGALASVEVAGYVKSLMLKVLQFLGYAAAKTRELTVSFVRWVLSMLFKAVQTAASRSLQMINFG